MTIKVYFNNEIHRFSKLPADFKALVNKITSAFKSQLPQSWDLHYIDSDGDKIIISHDHDYQELVETDSKGSNPIIKVYITPREVQSVSTVEIPAKEIDSNDDFQVIQRQETVIEGNKYSQDNREKINEQVIDNLKENENLSQGQPQPDNEEDDKKKMRSAKILVTKLVAGKHPEAKKVQLAEKMKELEKCMTLEQKEEIQKYQEKVEAKLAKSQTKKEQDDNNAHEKVEEKDEKAIAPINEEFSQENTIKPELNNADTIMSIPQETQTHIQETPVQDDSDSAGKPIHAYVKCDSCGTLPIAGIRYKCSKCLNFDFCETCEATKDHPHAFLKIKEPKLKRGKANSEIDELKRSKSAKAENPAAAFKQMVEDFRKGDVGKRCENILNKISGEVMGVFASVMQAIPEESKEKVREVLVQVQERGEEEKVKLCDKWKQLKDVTKQEKERIRAEKLKLAEKRKAQQAKLFEEWKKLKEKKKEFKEKVQAQKQKKNEKIQAMKAQEAQKGLEEKMIMKENEGKQESDLIQHA